ncbi:MAG TPA: hypothetical protein VKU39_19180 [Streptosporangiaceae bacterium]|nr:hypothetical protein [Streptosporangiaceae bacterium]
MPPPPVTGGALGNALEVDGRGDGARVRDRDGLGVAVAAGFVSVALDEGLGVRTAGCGDSLPMEMPGEVVLRDGALVPLAADGRGEPPVPPCGVLVAVGAGVAVGLAVGVGVPIMMLEPETLSDGPTIGDGPDEVVAEDDVHPTAKASTMTTNAQSRSLPIAHRLRESLH